MTLYKKSLYILCVFWVSWLAYAHPEQDHAKEDQKAIKRIKHSKVFTGKPRENHDFKQNGQWSEVIPWPHVPVSAALLPDGRILSWASNKKNAFPSKKEFTYTATWNPHTGEFKEIPHDKHDMFCGHQVILNDGRVFVNGGRNLVKTTSIFNYQTDAWDIVQPMNRGRWYPTSIALPDNRVLTLLGWGGGKYPEIWDEQNGWTVLNQIDLSAPILSFKNYFEYNWSPLIALAPSGQILHFGPTPNMHWLSVENRGKITPAPITNKLSFYPKESTSVMYSENQLLISGGSLSHKNEHSTLQAAILQMDDERVTATSIDSMHYARKFHNAVLLANGEVMIVGGNESGEKFQDHRSVLPTEIWNPQTKKFRVTADISIPRNYHSVALLMPDGRVFSAGGGLCGACQTNHPDAQIYSPPYLFDESGSIAVRPKILLAPQRANISQTISVKTDQEILSFSLIKTSSVTHSVNTDQRIIIPSFTAHGTHEYQLEMKDNIHIMPPGIWMLFALNQSGVPSMAQMIVIQDPNAPIIPPMNLSKSIEKTTKTSLNQPPSKPAQSIELKHTLTPKPVGDAIQYLLNTIGFSPSNYAWNFGDSSQEVNTMIGIAKHTFQKPGRYLVIVTATDSFGRRISHEFSQLIYQPTTGKPAKNSTPIVLDAREFLLWNVNYDHHSVTATHTHNLKQKAHIPVGQGPTSLQFNKDELLWVVNQQSATVSIIDPFIFQLVKTLQLPKNSQPFGIAFDDEFAYITLEAIAQVLVIQLTPLKILKRIPVHAHPRHIAYLPHKKQLYISHFITPPLESEKPNERARKKTPLENQGGIISVISAQTHTIKKIITLHPSTYHDSEHSARGVPNYLGALSISPEGTSAWVPGKQDNIFRGLYRDGQPLTHDTAIRSISAHIDLTTLEEKFDHRMDHDNAGVPTYALQDPSGSIMFVAFEGSQEIEAVDLYTQQPLFRFQVEQMPIGMVMSQNYSRLFVLNELSRSITAHDTQSFFSGKSENIPLVARTSTIPQEILPAILLKGKQLFHDAKDERLSQEQYLSCASCHHQGTQDGRVWDFSSLGEGLRNTISLIGKGQGHGLWHWSANFDEIQDFETPIRTLSGGLGLMKTTDYQKTAHPFGQKKQGKSSDLDALAAYVHSLNLYTPSPYQDDPKTQKMAIQGKKLFDKYRCASCHLGKNFTNSDQFELFNIGTVLPSSGHRLGGKLSGIDTPTLHQLWNTAPYLHNGMAHRLEEAIQMHQLPKNPTKTELIYLRAYLYILDGKTEVNN